MNPSEKHPGSGKVERHNGPVLVMPPPQSKADRWQLWRDRIFLGEFIFVCVVSGIILIVAPWTRLWTNNSLLLGFPQVQQFVDNYFVRGLISGLGWADLWLAVAEAVRYRERAV